MWLCSGRSSWGISGICSITISYGLVNIVLGGSLHSERSWPLLFLRQWRRRGAIAVACTVAGSSDI